MARTMSRPWHEIVKHFSAFKGERRSILAVANLASRVADSPYRNGLFAWTSHWNLCITQAEVSYPYHGPFLSIAPVGDDRVEFRYVDTRDRDLQWHREVPAEQAYDRLEKFPLTDLKWFGPLPTPPAS